MSGPPDQLAEGAKAKGKPCRERSARDRRPRPPGTSWAPPGNGALCDALAYPDRGSIPRAVPGLMGKGALRILCRISDARHPDERRDPSRVVVCGSPYSTAMAEPPVAAHRPATPWSCLLTVAWGPPRAATTRRTIAGARATGAEECDWISATWSATPSLPRSGPRGPFCPYDAPLPGVGGRGRDPAAAFPVRWPRHGAAGKPHLDRFCNESRLSFSEASSADAKLYAEPRATAGWVTSPPSIRMPATTKPS